MARDADFRYVQELGEHIDIDIWSDSPRSQGNVQVMVSPEAAPAFKSSLDFQRIKYALRHNNVQELAKHTKLTTFNEDKEMDWQNYHDLETIYAWMDELEGETEIFLPYSIQHFSLFLAVHDSVDRSHWAYL